MLRKLFFKEDHEMEYYPKRLIGDIHQMMFDLDSELGETLNIGYRRKLLKAVYALRDLDVFLSFRLNDYSMAIQTETKTEDACPVNWQSLN